MTGVAITNRQKRTSVGPISSSNRFAITVKSEYAIAETRIHEIPARLSVIFQNTKDVGPQRIDSDTRIGTDPHDLFLSHPATRGELTLARVALR